MSKQSRIIIAASAAVIALVAIGYFAVLPQIQANSYTSVVNKQQPALRDQMQQVVKLLDRDMFTKEQPDLTTIRSDIKAGKAAVADAKTQLEIADNKLVDFKEYPLLAWHSAYKSSLDLKAAEKTYVENAQATVTEMDKVLAYADKMADVKLETDTINTDVADIQDLDSPDQIIPALEKIKAKMQKAIADQKAITPPKSYEEAHEYSNKAANNMLNLYQQFITALKTEQYDQIDSIYANIQKADADLVKKQDDYNKKFLNDSALRKHIDKMLEADRKAKELLG